jgi:hypothetical protein
MIGRALMLFFIVFITHHNPILGLGAAAIIIIIHTNMSMVEGFVDTAPTTTAPTTTDNMAATTDLIAKIKDKLATAQSHMSPVIPAQPPQTTTTTTSSPTVESFSNIRRHRGQDRISSEQNIRPKSSRSLLGSILNNHGDPSPNFPDNHGFSGLFGSV